MRKTTARRLPVVDLIRPLAFVAVVIFHYQQIFFGSDLGQMPLVLVHYASFWSFAGILLVALTSLLTAYQQRLHWVMLVWLLGGWIVFSALTAWQRGDPFSWEWDVYPLLFLGWVSGFALLRFSRKQPWLLPVCGLVILFCTGPLTLFAGDDRCPSWPLFPWVGLVWLSMAAGQYLRHRPRGHRPLLLAVGLQPLTLVWGYDSIAPGWSWACHYFQQSRWQLLLHLAFWGGLVLGLGTWPTKYSLGLHRLGINRSFFCAYFLHFLLLFALKGFADFVILPVDGLWAAFWLALVLILTEVGSRIIPVSLRYR